MGHVARDCDQQPLSCDHPIHQIFGSKDHLHQFCPYYNPASIRNATLRQTVERQLRLFELGKQLSAQQTPALLTSTADVQQQHFAIDVEDLAAEADERFVLDALVTHVTSVDAPPSQSIQQAESDAILAALQTHDTATQTWQECMHRMLGDDVSAHQVDELIDQLVDLMALPTMEHTTDDAARQSSEHAAAVAATATAQGAANAAGMLGALLTTSAVNVIRALDGASVLYKQSPFALAKQMTAEVLHTCARHATTVEASVVSVIGQHAQLAHALLAAENVAHYVAYAFYMRRGFDRTAHMGTVLAAELAKVTMSAC